MHTYFYRIYGVVIASEFPLTSVHEPVASSMPADIEIKVDTPAFFQGLALGFSKQVGEGLHHVVLNDGRIYMRVDAVFEAIVSMDGKRVICRKLADVDHRSFEANLMNFVMSTSLTLQGEEPLHCTAVEMDGFAVGLLGHSGAGKSTLAGYLCSEGAQLLTDDLLRLKRIGSAWQAYPGPYRLKLFAEPSRPFLSADLEDGHFNVLSNKMMIRPNRESRPSFLSVPLAALFHLGDGADYSETVEISAVRLAGIEFARRIISSAMENRYSAPTRLLRQIDFAARLAESLPVYELKYPRAFDRLSDVAAQIRTLVATSHAEENLANVTGSPLSFSSGD